MKHFGDAAFGVCPPVFCSSLVHAYCGLSPLVCLQGSVLTCPCLVGFTSACPRLHRSISIHLSSGIVLISAVVYLHLYGMSAGVCSYTSMSSGVYLCLSMSISVYLYSPVFWNRAHICCGLSPPVWHVCRGLFLLAHV